MRSLVFDPFDLTSIDVRWQGRARRAGHPARHRPPRPSQSPARAAHPACPATGIDYMGLLDTAHDTALAGGAISFAGLSDPPGPAGPAQLPGQMTIDEALAQENP